MNQFDLTGSVAIVTGAGRGNGYEIAMGLQQNGAKIVAVDLAFDENNESEFYLIKGDVRLEETIEAAFNAALNISNKIILVNNAGITRPQENRYDIANWDLTMEINLKVPFLWMEAVRERAEKIAECAIINITSLGAERAFPNNPAYVAAKGGLKMLSKSYALELAKFGYRVNNLGPGYIVTQMTTQSYANPEKRKMREKQTMLGRWGLPQDLAGTAVFLASPAAAYITGQDIYVDGGWLAKGLIEDQ